MKQWHANLELRARENPIRQLGLHGPNAVRSGGSRPAKWRRLQLEGVSLDRDRVLDLQRTTAIGVEVVSLCESGSRHEGHGRAQRDVTDQHEPPEPLGGERRRRGIRRRVRTMTCPPATETWLRCG